MRFVVHHTALLYLAESGALISDEHELLAPSSSRSHVLSMLHEDVHRGELEAEAARQRLTYIRGLRMRLLGDAVMQRVAWELADRLDWPATYDAEYIALTTLQADAFITVDERLARAARDVVSLATVDSITR